MATIRYKRAIVFNGLKLPVADARHKFDAKQIGEDGLRLPLGVGVERVRLDIALVLEQPIQDIDGLPTALSGVAYRPSK
jgi:hypothetical protein